MISCNDIKLEDITVTFQPNIPRKPIMAMAEKTQQSIGNTTQRILPKIMLKVMIRKNAIPMPNIFKSCLTKRIKSSVITLIPPRKSWASCRYLSIMARMAAISSFRICLRNSRRLCICFLRSLNSIISASVRVPPAAFSRKWSIRTSKSW